MDGVDFSSGAIPPEDLPFQVLKARHDFHTGRNSGLSKNERVLRCLDSARAFLAEESKNKKNASAISLEIGALLKEKRPVEALM